MTNFDPYEFERPPIVLTGADRARLAALADAATHDNPDVARFLHEELARADIVPERSWLGDHGFGGEVYRSSVAQGQTMQTRLSE